MFEETGSFVNDTLAPWFADQVSAVGNQVVPLTLSAVVGGVVSWSITRRSDNKARNKQVRRDEEARCEQERRDKQRNLFEYRYWRAQSSGAEAHDWNLALDTTPFYRYNWTLSLEPTFSDRLHTARFFLESIVPGKTPVELTNKYETDNKKFPSYGVRWVALGRAEETFGHWEPVREDFCFAFDIGTVIDETDYIVVNYTTEAGGEVSVTKVDMFYIYPFDSMKDYRPWELIELSDDE